jgi:chemotaxis protein methyltransferase CheR
MLQITEQEFADFSQYIHEMTGIVIPREKTYLLESRMQPILAEHGLGSFAELYRAARAEKRKNLAKEIIDAITTNETFFFRDNKPFELLRNKILPDIIDRRRRGGAVGRIPLRIWSAACSSGQEVYSIAMTLSELLPVREYDIRILGTDISSKALAVASYGQYNAFEVQRGLPDTLSRKYFLPGAGGGLRVRDELRGMARFEKINLLQPLVLQERFDVIFCRNVAIYFSRPDKARLFNNLGRMLQPDGALILGGSETLTGMDTGFVSRNYLQAIYYQLQPFVDAESAPPAQPPEDRPRPPSVPPPLSPGSAPFQKIPVRKPAPRSFSPPVTPSELTDTPLSPAAQEMTGAPAAPVTVDNPDNGPVAKKTLLSALGSESHSSGSLLSALRNRKSGGGKEAESLALEGPAASSLLAGIKERHLARKHQPEDSANAQTHSPFPEGTGPLDQE